MHSNNGLAASPSPAKPSCSTNERLRASTSSEEPGRRIIGALMKTLIPDVELGTLGLERACGDRLSLHELPTRLGSSLAM
ncbi:MAG: hypothetical protein ACI841_001407 [Planctomycetota bacterium]|jgi:hypothetical protein